MIYILVFYWLITGVTLFVLPGNELRYNKREFIICLLLGGIIIPCRLLYKILE